MNIDKPLEELIKQNPRTRGGKARTDSRKKTSRGGSAAAGNVKGAASTSRNQRAAVNNASRPPVVIPGRGSGPLTGSKIILSNLPFDVTEPQVRVSARRAAASMHASSG